MSTTPSSSALQQIKQRRSRTLTSIVREEIAGIIASGELSSGDRINESELATRLGISRGPVREACRSLEEAGLLVSVVNQGVFVREMSLEDARELYQVRGALSGLIGRLAAEHATSASLDTLRVLVDAMNKAADQQDLSGYYKLNLEFHDLLMKIANNRMLADLYLSVIKQTHLFRRRGLVQQGSLKTSNQEHQAILEALERHDGAAAEQALTLHVAKGWTRLANSIEST
ncbi:MAG: GntR family transcriptional regulator [Polaromonas sp.]|nr:GntR family transcriptional regulator [Polaromonas sp.]